VLWILNRVPKSAKRQLLLMLTGSDSSDPSTADIETVAAALPDARILVLEGQQHVADILVPEVVADEVARFLSE
jgi:hypothetical protein